MIRTVTLLGLAFADLTAAEAAETIAARPEGAPFGYVVTPNADHLVRMSRDPDLAAIYRAAWLRLLDSRVVAAMAGKCGLPVPRVATDSDLTSLLLRRHIHRDEKITIIGLRPAWLPALVDQFGLAQPGHYDPPMGFDNDPGALADTVAFILSHPARFVFLAVGSPRQERLAAAVAATRRGTGDGALHRRQPRVSVRRGAAGARMDATEPAGMGLPAGHRSAPAGAAISGGQSAHRAAP